MEKDKAKALCLIFEKMVVVAIQKIKKHQTIAALEVFKSIDENYQKVVGKLSTEQALELNKTLKNSFEQALKISEGVKNKISDEVISEKIKLFS